MEPIRERNRVFTNCHKCGAILAQCSCAASRNEREALADYMAVREQLADLEEREVECRCGEFYTCDLCTETAEKSHYLRGITEQWGDNWAVRLSSLSSASAPAAPVPSDPAKYHECRWKKKLVEECARSLRKDEQIRNLEKKLAAARAASSEPTPRIYAASRASVPERPAMWKSLRAAGANIVSSWIDEAEPGATADLSELWERIYREIQSCDVLVLYVEPNDFPLKGALIEAGIALGLGKPIRVVAPSMNFDAPSYRPIGSWIKHRNVTVVKDLKQALAAASSEPAGTEKEQK